MESNITAVFMLKSNFSEHVWMNIEGLSGPGGRSLQKASCWHRWGFTCSVSYHWSVPFLPSGSPSRTFTCLQSSSKSSITVSLGGSPWWVSAQSAHWRSFAASQKQNERRRRREGNGDVRETPRCSRKTHYEHVQHFPLCVCSCLGETPHLISEDVFIDIDDEEPLVPNQVKPSCCGSHCFTSFSSSLPCRLSCPPLSVPLSSSRLLAVIATKRGKSDP